MAFKFNFFGGDQAVESSTTSQLAIPEKEAAEIAFNPCPELRERLGEETFEQYRFDEIILKKAIRRKTASLDISEELKAALSKADLIPGVYEGGFKQWECGEDLLDYLYAESIPPADAKVLEIGCGHGIPGLFCLQRGAAVSFQDYNDEVILQLTQLNYLLNFPEPAPKQPRFYSGDWRSFNILLGAELFDLVLTADCIYNDANYDKLLDLIHRHLAPDGKCLVAAKTYYFGVGGGTRLLEMQMEKHQLRSRVLRTFQDGKSNIREILEVTRA